MPGFTVKAGTGPSLAARQARLPWGLGGISECHSYCVLSPADVPNHAVGQGQQHTANPSRGSGFKEVIRPCYLGRTMVESRMPGEQRHKSWLRSCLVKGRGAAK